ncbi:MAG: ATP-grasp domain-containing protein [Candidatus Binatia bacterium]
MNLLVTNTRNAQAYAIIRALRPHAEKIVATMEGEKRLAARFSHAANSRLVDKRCYTPSPAKDWRAGRIQKENTEAEEVYIRALLGLCEKEKIDTIFPSFDPHVYVFSKNKEKFEKIGVLIPVPDFEIVLTLLDKYRTIRAAQEMCFPCPKTYLPQDEQDLPWIAERLGFPVVIKPRFGAGGRGATLVKNFTELSEKTHGTLRIHHQLMIQEYIPGNLKTQCYIALDKNRELKLALYVATLRNTLRETANLSTVAESLAPEDILCHAKMLLETLGWWGSATVQLKIDSRSDVPKLMEINPRPGIRLWQRTALGFNEPLICLEIARGQTMTAMPKYPPRILLIEPIEDFLGLGLKCLDLAIYGLRVSILAKSPSDPDNPPMGFLELVRAYKKTYFNGRKKLYNHYFTFFFHDPIVSLLWWMQFFALALRNVKQLGR